MLYYHLYLKKITFLYDSFSLSVVKKAMCFRRAASGAFHRCQ